MEKGSQDKKKSEKKHARFMHCHLFDYIVKYKYNNEKQRNTEKNTRVPQKIHSEKLTQKHNKLQKTHLDDP